MPKLDGVPTGAPCWIDLMSSDTDKSRAFYGDLFGWTSEAGRRGVRRLHQLLQGRRAGRRPDGQAARDGRDARRVVDLPRRSRTPTRSRRPSRPTAARCIVAPMDVVDLGTMAVFTDAGGAAIGAWQPKEFKSFQIAFEDDTPGWFELHTRDFDKTDRLLRGGLRLDHPGRGRHRRVPLHDDGRGRGRSTPGSWTPRPACPTACPPTGRSTSRSPTPTRRWPRSASSAATPSCPAEDTPYGRLATAVDPTGAIFKLVG